eukprot:CAMPEP_0172539476 /NCGR_PEP_ID=MMETSP1067-20121228/10669_1 /TAXON_ID=265564 ORGANISM="Thalassiosira punctigera, Strain Tpunct2005C2" /NCGR_SAMPLE_ID=MMETSP1067 /ASSEMBLY_ACC=CAM_ASM_000444 /LENGTH=371 /DNA_ID=CAMNT_0013325169 /DNA_START=105 /DNA_END=1220 /DNA_ORIENTATION=-
MSEVNKRVLSIQSHVVSGYVGNKAAVFPLQLLGFDVDVINSVQFSNHTGYPFGWEGEVLDGSMLGKLVDGMDRNGLLSSDDDDSGSGGIGNILTGYIGSESFLRAVVSVVTKLKDSNAGCRYICDPVLGDMGRFYVPEGLVDIYRRDVLPLADVITPNQFEVEQLTGISIETIRDAQRACRILHDSGVSVVLITSIVFPEGGSGDGDASKGMSTAPSRDSIGMFASQRQFRSRSARNSRNINCDTEQEQQKAQHTDEQYILYMPRLDGQFTGTGDVCAALFLGWTADGENAGENGDSPLKCALEKLAGTMQAIVQRTATAAAKKRSSASATGKAKMVSSRELQLVQSREDILNPPRNFGAVRVECNADAKC